MKYMRFTWLVMLGAGHTRAAKAVSSVRFFGGRLSRSSDAGGLARMLSLIVGSRNFLPLHRVTA